MTTITINRALLEQTLQALVRTYHYGGVIAADAECITALRAALAEPVQEQHERELTEVLAERDEAEDYIDALLDEVLGPDRAEWSSAYDRADALEEVRERIDQMLKPSIDKAWNRFEAEPVEPVAYIHRQGNYWDTSERHLTDDEKARGWTEEPLYTAPPQRKPLTIERLRDALVASRIIPPAAVEDPDEYDDGVTLHRIEALHRRIT